jgi:hydrogenase maturation protein HypF
MLLEALAAASGDPGDYPFGQSGGAIDPAPMFRALAQDLRRGAAREDIARRFHAGLARAFAGAVRRAADEAGTRTVALSGGCFQNLTLLGMVRDLLGDLELCLPAQVPANDGGLAFGQALVALARLETL